MFARLRASPSFPPAMAARVADGRFWMSTKTSLTAPFYMAGMTIWEALRGVGGEKVASVDVSAILEARRPERQILFAVDRLDPAHAALELMVENHIDCVAVLGDPSDDWTDDRHSSESGGSEEQTAGTPASAELLDEPQGLVGLLTLSDYLRRVALPRLDSTEVLCGSIMTPADQVAYVYAGNSVESCLGIMAEMRCHHLPVLDGAGQSVAGAASDAEAETPQLGGLGGGVLLGIVSMDELLGLTSQARDRNVGLLSHSIRKLGIPGIVHPGASSD